jgi:DNA replication and repair protein RecF
VVRLTALELVNFRGWGELSLSLPEGPIAFVGANATGKTSILEAIWYAATLSSHRAAADAVLVRAGETAAIVRASVTHDGRDDLLELEIVTHGRARTKLGGSPVGRRRDVLGTVRASLFAPERIAVVRGDPGERRRFVDELLVQLHPRYHAVIREYERAVRQRNALLREAGGRAPSGLEAWDEAVSRPGGELCAGRADAIRALAPPAADAYRKVGGESALQARYVPKVQPQADDASAEDWTRAILEGLVARRSDELARGTTLVGPHRDDVELLIGGLPARTHASQGEAWLAALALVLGMHGAIGERVGAQPVLLLDDAFSLLDPERREKLGSALPSGAQMIATASDGRELPSSQRWKHGRVTVAGVEFDV